MSRLQAGARAVFPRAAHVGEIVATALEALGPQPQPVLADIPSGLPEVIADPAIAERVIVNLTGNALRYSPAAAPLLLTARTAGNRVELRVVDHGPGIAAADRHGNAYLSAFAVLVANFGEGALGALRVAQACQCVQSQCLHPRHEQVRRREQPLPGGADSTVTRADAPSCSNSPGRGTTPPRPGRAARPATSSGPSAGPTARSSHDASRRIEAAIHSRPLSRFRPRESGHPGRVAAARPAGHAAG